MLARKVVCSIGISRMQNLHITWCFVFRVCIKMRWIRVGGKTGQAGRTYRLIDVQKQSMTELLEATLQ